MLSWTREEVRKEWAEDAKHDGDSGLASDQIPGQNQNNTVSSLVTLYCITTRPFAVIHPCTVAHEEIKCKPDRELRELRKGFNTPPD